MKKLIAILFASVMFFYVPATAEIAVGITANFSTMDTDGKEVETTGDAETNTASVSEDVLIREVFIDAVGDNGLAFGVAYIPVRELGDGTRTDATASEGSDTDDAGVKSVSAELRSLVMFYSDIPVGPVYVKLGVQRAEVVIEESLNGTTYEDETLLGYTVGLGYRGSIGDAFYKAELAHTSFDEYKSTASTQEVRVEADTDVTSARISVGYAF